MSKYDFLVSEQGRVKGSIAFGFLGARATAQTVNLWKSLDQQKSCWGEYLNMSVTVNASNVKYGMNVLTKMD